MLVLGKVWGYKGLSNSQIATASKTIPPNHESLHLKNIEIENLAKLLRGTRRHPLIPD